MEKFKISDVYIKSEMSGETVLFDPITHNILSLNTTAQIIYESLDGKTYEEVVNELQKKYQRMDIENDIREQIDILEKMGVVKRI